LGISLGMMWVWMSILSIGNVRKTRKVLKTLRVSVKNYLGASIFAPHFLQHLLSSES
jgi:hypothetical protein